VWRSSKSWSINKKSKDMKSNYDYINCCDSEISPSNFHQTSRVNYLTVTLQFSERSLKSECVWEEDNFTGVNWCLQALKVYRFDANALYATASNALLGRSLIKNLPFICPALILCRVYFQTIVVSSLAPNFNSFIAIPRWRIYFVMSRYCEIVTQAH
jgi:hypothetical protein